MARVTKTICDRCAALQPALASEEASYAEVKIKIQEITHIEKGGDLCEDCFSQLAKELDTLLNEYEMKSF